MYVWLRNCLLTASILLVIGVDCAKAQAAQPTLQALAGRRQVDMLTISPDGDRLAFIAYKDGEPRLIMVTTSGQALGVVNVGKVKPIRVLWADNDTVIFSGSKTDKDFRFRAGHKTNEYTRAVAYHISTRKITGLLSSSMDELSPTAINLGNVIAVDAASDAAWIPALDNQFRSALFKVDLKSGRGHPVTATPVPVSTWIMGPDHKPIARVLHEQRSNYFAVETRDADGKWTAIFQKLANLAPFSVVGLNMDRDSLVIDTTFGKNSYERLFQLELDDGRLFMQPMYEPEGHDIDTAITDPYSGLVVGVSWLQDQEQYYWFDPVLENVQKTLQASLKGKSVHIENWSRDRTKFVVAMSAPGRPPDYAVFYVQTGKLVTVAQSRPALTKAVLGKTTSHDFEARDGLHIPAYLTLPPGKEDAKGLPLVVLPHGGPEARDSAEYDWLAQVFATRGYAVFQPNFRGSDGYGMKFTRAGWGEWGKAMQDDITDGVNNLIAEGTADHKRICIVGASYGGYAALAGGAFTPDLYQCVVSFAGVTDLPKMVDWVRGKYGRDHWVMQYWERFMTGDDEEVRKKMRAISPADHADAFKAPVLLIHGKDDTVVPIQQSKIMQGALKRAHKPVTLIQEKKGDHWLSYEDTRLETVRAMLDFVQANIGQDAQ